MALFDSLLTPGGGAPDADAVPVPLKKRLGLFDSGAPTVPTNGNAPVAPGDIAAPDMGQPSANTLSNVPWAKMLPGYVAPQPQKPARMNPITGEAYPTTKGGMLLSFLKNGIEGALAGRASSENAIIASGGRRSGGVGMGFEAGLEAPAQQAMTAQTLQRGRQQNQMTQMQINQVNALNAAYSAGTTPDPQTGAPTFDRNKVIQSLARSGQGAAIPGLVQTFASMDKTQGEVRRRKTSTRKLPTITSAQPCKES